MRFCGRAPVRSNLDCAPQSVALGIDESLDGGTHMDEVLAVLQEISEKLSEISSKLDTLSGGIDDIVTGLKEVPDQITGDMRCNLTDIFKELSEINGKTTG